MIVELLRVIFCCHGFIDRRKKIGDSELFYPILLQIKLGLYGVSVCRR
jgi:hypothetical protein